LVSTLVQYTHGDSFFHRLDPRSKIVSMLMMTFMIVAVENLWLAAAILLTMVLLWCLAGLSLSVLKDLATPMIGLGVFLLIVQALLYPGDRVLIQPIVPRPIPILGGRGSITLDGILFAVLLSFRLLAMVILLPLVTMTTPLHIFTLGLVRLGLPYRLASTMTTALNLIPILQTEATTIADAQKLRAFQVFEKGSFYEKLKAYPSLVTPLIIGAMRRAQLIAVAMDSRAFGASAHRTYIHEIRMRQRDWVFLTLAALFAGAAGLTGFLIR
jgi:energy-coupling factor transport system permease protein